MDLPDLSFIDEVRALEVEAIDAGRSTSEFTLAPGSANFDSDVGEGEDIRATGSRADCPRVASNAAATITEAAPVR